MKRHRHACCFQHRPVVQRELLGLLLAARRVHHDEGAGHGIRRERIDDLVVTVDVPGLAFTSATLASGGQVRVRSGPSGGSAVFVVGRLSVGDAIILR